MPGTLSTWCILLLLLVITSFFKGWTSTSVLLMIFITSTDIFPTRNCQILFNSLCTARLNITIVLFEHQNTDNIRVYHCVLLFIFYTLHTFQKYTQKTKDTIFDINILMSKHHFTNIIWFFYYDDEVIPQKVHFCITKIEKILSYKLLFWYEYDISFFGCLLWCCYEKCAIFTWQITVQDINISEQLQSLISPAILPWSFISLQVSQA